MRMEILCVWFGYWHGKMKPWKGWETPQQKEWDKVWKEIKENEMKECKLNPTTYSLQIEITPTFTIHLPILPTKYMFH